MAEKRLIDANEALRMIYNSEKDNPYLRDELLTDAWNCAHVCSVDCINACKTEDSLEVETIFREKLDAATRKVKDLERELSKVRSEREYFRSRSDFFSEVAATSGRVISVEGYKAFRGTMRISPRGTALAYELCGDWLYKPETGCWYGNGRSFPKEVCTILERKE